MISSPEIVFFSRKAWANFEFTKVFHRKLFSENRAFEKEQSPGRWGYPQQFFAQFDWFLKFGDAFQNDIKM